MTLLAVNDTLENPAFLRFHPDYNILYACTEDITRENEVRVVVVPTTNCVWVGGWAGVQCLAWRILFPVTPASLCALQL